jgi:hypothetical protein
MFSLLPLVLTTEKDLFYSPVLHFLKGGFSLAFQTCISGALIRLTPPFTYSFSIIMLPYCDSPLTLLKFLFILFFWDRILPCSSDWLGTHCVSPQTQWSSCLRLSAAITGMYHDA